MEEQLRGWADYREDEDDSLLPAQRCQVAQVIMDFPDVFTEVPGTARGWEHKRETLGSTVGNTPIHFVLLAMQEMVQQEVEKMLQIGVVEESLSLGTAPLSWCLSQMALAGSTLILGSLIQFLLLILIPCPT